MTPSNEKAATVARAALARVGLEVAPMHVGGTNCSGCVCGSLWDGERRCYEHPDILRAYQILGLESLTLHRTGASICNTLWKDRPDPFQADSSCGFTLQHITPAYPED
jgi:hypothetical protein